MCLRSATPCPDDVTRLQGTNVWGQAEGWNRTSLHQRPGGPYRSHSRTGWIAPAPALGVTVSKLHKRIKLMRYQWKNVVRIASDPSVSPIGRARVSVAVRLQALRRSMALRSTVVLNAD